MTSLQAWNEIVNRLKGNRIELPTVPKVKKDPVWFSATTNGETIFINKAIEHKPSSKLTVERRLKYSTFEKVYPLYLRRENGEQVSSEVTAITVNQVYYFSLIRHFINNS
ncbi:hypothetical protein [Psychrobacillus sp. L3]|uniref:hypothetical protein n=1 Tax=Psychrobacillus sp. L3 TaxID=3236891 RepID=UPI0036F3174D